MMIGKSINAMTSGVAGRYALALFEIAEEENLRETVARDITQVQDIINSSRELEYLTKAPVFKAEQQIKVWKKIAEKAGFNRITTNFLCLLAKKRRSSKIKQIIKVFFQIEKYKSGQQIVEITSAVKIKQQYIKNFEKIVKNRITNNYKIITKIDESIIGGIIIKYSSYVVDMSIKEKLNKLRYWTKKVT